MNVFQQIGLLLLGLWAIIMLVALARHRVQMRAAFGWLAVCAAAAAAIADPAITVRLARLLGIGRGADLVFYSGILFMIFGSFFVYLRFKRLEREITILVRQLAIRDAERDPRVEVR